MITRPGTYDEMIVKEQRNCYKELNFADKIVMDIGGNNGKTGQQY